MAASSTVRSGLSMNFEVQGLKEFNNVMADYMKWSKRQPSEIVNNKLYFIALNALNTTKAATASGIRNELNAPSNKNPDQTLGEILTLKDLQQRGKMPKKGKTLLKNMAKYVTKFINKRVGHINFLRSGWLPTIKKLDYWNRKGDINFLKRYAPKLNRAVKQFGKEKGDVIPAKPDRVRVTGTMISYIGQGKQETESSKAIITEGLTKALRLEINSMRTYLERKYKEKMDKINKTSTFK